MNYFLQKEQIQGHSTPFGWIGPYECALCSIDRMAVSCSTFLILVAAPSLDWLQHVQHIPYTGCSTFLKLVAAHAASSLNWLQHLPYTSCSTFLKLVPAHAASSLYWLQHLP